MDNNALQTIQPPIRIAIADDETLFRKGFILLFEDNPNFEVVLEATDGQNLLNQLEGKTDLFDVLLLDLNMPNLDGIQTAKILKEKYPEMHFIILSTYFSKSFIVNMIEIGAASYLPKNSLPKDVKSTIREVHKNGFSFSKEVMEIIRENMVNKTRPKLNNPFSISLTNREKEILQLICEEYTTPEIAKKLFISPRTVDGHRNNLLQKLNCRNVAGLVIYAIQQQMVKILPGTTGFASR